MQACIDPPPTPLIKLEVDDEFTNHIIKVKMRRNPSLAASKTYNINMNMFDDVQPGELLLLLKNLRIAIDGTRTTTAYGQINYRSTMLRGKTLREFNELQSKYGGSTNNHIKLIQEGLLEYFFPINEIS